MTFDRTWSLSNYNWFLNRELQKRHICLGHNKKQCACVHLILAVFGHGTSFAYGILKVTNSTYRYSLCGVSTCNVCVNVCLRITLHITVLYQLECVGGWDFLSCELPWKKQIMLP